MVFMTYDSIALALREGVRGSNLLKFPKYDFKKIVDPKYLPSH